MNKPKVSIIVPVYNTEKYIQKCLDSLVNQTLLDIEIICVNDCSSDNSLKVLQKYTDIDNRIKIINFTQNKGVSIARNEALKIATGEYAGFVDSDDYVDLDFYEKLYNKAIENNADICRGTVKEIRFDGNIIEYNYKSVEKTGIKYYFTNSFTSAIYCLKNIKKFKLFFPENITWAEDTLFLQQNVMKANRVVFVDDTYYYYIRRKNSANGETLDFQKIKDAFESYKLMFNNIENICDNKLDDKFYMYYYYITCSTFIGLYYKTNLLESKKFIINDILYFYKNTKHKQNMNYIFNNSFPWLLSYIEDNNINKVFEFLDKYNTDEKRIIASLRLLHKKSKK